MMFIVDVRLRGWFWSIYRDWDNEYEDFSRQILEPLEPEIINLVFEEIKARESFEWLDKYLSILTWADLCSYFDHFLFD